MPPRIARGAPSATYAASQQWMATALQLREQVCQQAQETAQELAAAGDDWFEVPSSNIFAGGPSSGGCTTVWTQQDWLAAFDTVVRKNDSLRLDNVVCMFL